MTDSLSLFGDAPAFDIIPMIDADVKFMRAFYDTLHSEHLKNTLIEETPWRQEKIVLWGKEHLQPRLSAWYGDAGNAYSYSGIKLEPSPWTATLLRIREDIERMTGHCFNSVLLNLYRDEHDSVGWHSDDEIELGKHPAIASLSLGETRIFKLRHKTRKDQKTVLVPLGDGSLLLMTGATQHFWRHAVDKEKKPKGARLNLTFRTVVPA